MPVSILLLCMQTFRCLSPIFVTFHNYFHLRIMEFHNYKHLPLCWGPGFLSTSPASSSNVNNSTLVFREVWNIILLHHMYLIQHTPTHTICWLFFCLSSFSSAFLSAKICWQKPLKIWGEKAIILHLGQQTFILIILHKLLATSLATCQPGMIKTKTYKNPPL